MTFKTFAEYLQRLEQTTLRIKMTEILSELFTKAKGGEIGEICHLLKGRVAPLYVPIEFGVADQMEIRAIAMALNVDREKVTLQFKKTGDLGITAEKLKNEKSKSKITIKNLNISEVFESLKKIAISSGPGSQELKIKLLSELIEHLDPLSCRYVVRIPINKLRLGFSDMTVLDALSWYLSGNKSHRADIEKAYNVRPDIAFISNTIKEKGIAGLSDTKPKVGAPILMARAERMTSAEDIILKIGKCAIEAKYDGFRLQAHLQRIKNHESGIKNKIKLYSRNLEDVTHMYPDIVEGLDIEVKAKEAIIEGEAVAFNPNTGEYLPFQETSQRRRKYDVEAKAKELPLKLFAFELLFCDGKSYLMEPYRERKDKLKSLVQNGDTILFAKEEITDDPKRVEEIFQDTVSKGLEGIMAKKLDGIYRAGSRDFNWIKFKRSYAGKLNDTIDCVVMGYDFGQGKRTGFGIGDFLIGVYDEKNDKYLTVAKIGTGLTDEEWRELKVKCQKSNVKNKPDIYEVDKLMFCDVWVHPEIVVEIRADEITRSPVHTAGRVMQTSKSGKAFEVKEAGLALRFPRLERFRDDKRAIDATTLKELHNMYNKQINK